MNIRQILRILTLLWHQPELVDIRANANTYWQTMKWSIRFVVAFTLPMLLMATLGAPEVAGVMGFIVTFAICGWSLLNTTIIVIVCQELSIIWTPLREAERIAKFLAGMVGYILVLYTAMWVIPAKGWQWPMFLGVMITLLVVSTFRGWESRLWDWVLRFYFFAVILMIAVYVFVPETYKLMEESLKVNHDLRLGKGRINLSVTKEANAQYLNLKRLCASIDLPSMQSFRTNQPRTYALMQKRCAAMEQQFKVRGTVLGSINDYPPQREWMTPVVVGVNNYPVTAVWCGPDNPPDCRCKYTATPWRLSKLEGSIYAEHNIYVIPRAVLASSAVASNCREYLAYQQKCEWKTIPADKPTFCSDRQTKWPTWVKRKRTACFRAIRRVSGVVRVLLKDLETLSFTGGEFRILVPEDSGNAEVPPASGKVAFVCSHAP